MDNPDKTDERLTCELLELQQKYNSLKAQYENDITEHKLANEALRESEDRYRHLIETTDTGYVIIDNTGCVIDANQEYIRLSGHKNLSEILGRSVEEWTSDEEKEANAQAVATCLRNGFIRNLEVTYIDKAGNRTPVEINATVMGIDDKQRILTLCRNISERKRGEEIQKQTSSLLRATLESTADGILVVDLSGKVSSFNKKFSELWHIPGQILDTGNDNQLISFILDQLKDSGQFLSKVNELYTQPHQESFDIIEFKDGRVFERYSQPQKVDNEIAGRVWSFRDITSRKQLEKDLHESVQHYKLVSELATDYVYKLKIDGGGRVTMDFVSDNFYSITGRTKEDVNAVELWQSILYPDDLPKVMEHLQKLMLKPEVTELECRSYIHGQKLRWITIVSKSEWDEQENRVTTIVGAVKDITERKKAEEALIRIAQEWQTTFDANLDAIWLLDKDQQIVRSNKRAEQIFGLLCNAMEGKHCWEIVHGSTHPIHECPSLRARKSLTRESMQLQIGERWFDVSIDPILDDEGNYSGSVHIVSDITERKQTETLLKEKTDELGTQNNEYLQLIEELHQINNELHTTKEKTEENERKFNAITNQATEGIAVASMDGKYVFVNPAFCHMTGYAEEELLKMTVYDVRVKSQPMVFFENKAKMNGVPIPVVLQHKNGTEFFTEIIGSIIKINNQDFILGTVRDITERKKTEDALRESEERFSKAYKTSPISFIIASLEDGRIIEVNEAFTTISGFTREEALASTTLQLKIWVNEEDRLQMVATLREGKAVVRQETMLRIKNGTIVTVLLSAQIIQLGYRHCIISSIEDITERKQAEIEIVKAKEKAESYASLIRNITDNIPAFIAVVDANTLKYKFVNQKFITGFKKKREDIIGAHISEIIGEPNTEFAMKYIDEVKQGKTSSYINTFEIAEGKRHINVNYVPGFNDKGEVAEIIVLSFDVTPIKESEQELQKAKEKAEESDRLKSAFLQNMSHEIRTPMNAIMGFSSLLVEYYNNKPKLEQFSEIINQRCNDLLEIINDILDIAKIESGLLSVHIEECNLFELFTELTTFFKEHQKRIDKQQIKFSLQAFCDSSENIIVTDKVKLKQILINLIGNAFKFTDTGKIEGGCKFDADHSLVFYVSDTGIGIPADKHDTVFERFSQLEHNEKLVFGGTGLGLPIVKGLVSLLGGKIWLESKPGKGTTFYFSFPYKISQTTPGKPVLEVENQTYHFPGKTILVVEDDHYNTAYIKEILFKTGINIIHTRYGIEAVQIAISQSVDLALMDIRLPDIDGYEATRQIIQHKPTLKVIAQTAYAAHEDKQKAFDSGCIDYLSKPLNRDMLLATISKHL